MENEDGAIFREAQQFPLWMRMFVLTSMAAALVVTAFALSASPQEQKPEALWEAALTLLVAVVLPILVGLLFFTARLETEVRSDGLYVRYTPFHIHFRRFGKEEIEQYYPRVYKPLREFGGYGLRCSFKPGGGRAYNVKGNHGLQLVFRDGRKLLIGSQEPHLLVRALDSIASGEEG